MSRPSWSQRVAVLLLSGGLLACQKQAAPPAQPPPLAEPDRPSGEGEGEPPPMPPQVVLAAGDIGNCASDGDEATAAMLDDLPGTLVTLGDTAYPTGSTEAFARCYAPTWGRHKARTRPVPGNHEYMEPGAAPYFDYFGEAAGERGKGYYSYELGRWHVVALNSELTGEAGLEQQRWLREDLSAHPARCTLAYMHRPLFTSMATRNNTAWVRPLWDALYEAGAEVVLAGHDHFYERFAPQTPAGVLDAERGLRQFVVGTGGTFFYALEPAPANSRMRIGNKHGVLKLTLEDKGYTWEFLQTDGNVGDQGLGVCH